MRLVKSTITDKHSCGPCDNQDGSGISEFRNAKHLATSDLLIQLMFFHEFFILMIFLNLIR